MKSGQDVHTVQGIMLRLLLAVVVTSGLLMIILKQQMGSDFATIVSLIWNSEKKILNKGGICVDNI
jgi:hypothetical protein